MDGNNDIVIRGISDSDDDSFDLEILKKKNKQNKK